MTSTNVKLAGPNAIFLNVILAVIAFILIIYLRNIYVTIISVVIVVGVYLVFDTKALFKLNEDPATPYIESEDLVEDENSAGNSVENAGPVVFDYQEVEIEKVGCSDYDLNDPNIIQIKHYTDFFTDENKTNAQDPSKIFLLMNDIDFEGKPIYGSVFGNFHASLDGNCFSISNFTIENYQGYWKLGFFSNVISKNNTKIYIKNITFTDFSFNITTDSAFSIGIVGNVESNNTIKSEDDIVFENVTVHLNRPSLLTITKDTRWFNIGILAGNCDNVKLLDCNIISSSRYDLLINSNSYSGLSLGMLAGYITNSYVMACSVNMIGSNIILHTPGVFRMGLLCGATYGTDKQTYINLLNNLILLKDATLKSDFMSTDYGYLIGNNDQRISSTAKNNTISDFLIEDYFGNTNKLSNIIPNFDVNENNKMNQLGSLDPSEVSISNQIYGLTFSDGSKEGNTENVEDDIYWKRVYYVYYEGNTSNMNCRKYKVFNFWKNTELKTYCEADDNCNTHMYGVCDSGKNRRGWTQFKDNVTINCQSNGKTTYTLTSDFTAKSDFTPIILDDGVTFDGGGHTITALGEWYGLFKFVQKDYKLNVTIKNVTLDIQYKIASSQGGIVGSSLVAANTYAKYNIIILNCHVIGKNIESYAGGIVGRYFCADGDSTGKIVYCSNSCPIYGVMAGGICGSFACNYGGKLDVIGCWNTGHMRNYRIQGGIIGAYSGSNSALSHLLVFNCYNQGYLGNNSGGIVGASTIDGTRLMVLNCYSYCQFETPASSSLMFGGIVGQLSGMPYVINCDVYFTNDEITGGNPPLNVPSGTNLDKLISRSSFVQLTDPSDSTQNMNINSVDEYSKRNEFNYHNKNFNSYKLNSLIDTLPYEILSPLWNSDNLSIPMPNFNGTI